MKRNETASQSNLILKLVVVATAAALSACAMTGLVSSDELAADMQFNEIHHGP